MIEYYSPHKRIILKAIAMLIVVSFVWYDIAWAGDLFYYNIVPKAVDNLSGNVLPKKLSGDPGGKKEVTNYDLLDSRKREDGRQSLMPSYREQEQSNNFNPAYVKEQQAKHEEIVGIKTDIENLDNLRNGPKRKDEEVELKKKKSGGGGAPYKYTLSDFDPETQQPQTLNVYTYNQDGSLKNITSYDISGKDVSQWMAGATDVKTKDGSKLMGGSKDANLTGLTEDDMIEQVFYTGAKGHEVIDYALSEFYDGQATELTLYNYNGSGGALSQTLTYDITDMNATFNDPTSKSQWIGLLTEDKLYSESLYTGAKDEEKIDQTFYYQNGSITGRTDYQYNDSGALTGVYSFDVTDVADTSQKRQKSSMKYNADGTLNLSEGGSVFTGDLQEEYDYTGEKGKELINQVFDYTKNADGTYDVTERTDYDYNSIGKLLNTYKVECDIAGQSEADKRRKSTVVYNADGTVDFDKSDFNGDLEEETVYQGSKGHERVSQVLGYDGNEITDRTDYTYSGRRLVSTSAYDVDGLTEADKRKLGAGSLLTDGQQFFTGAAGREKVSYGTGYSDIDPGDTELIDPRSQQFRDMLQNLRDSGVTVIINENETGDISNATFNTVEIPSESRIYTYTSIPSISVTEAVNGNNVNTFYYDADNNLELVNSHNTTSTYEYKSGALYRVIQFVDNGGVANKYDAGTDTLKSEVIYLPKSSPTDKDRIDYIIKYSNGVYKSTSKYTYDTVTNCLSEVLEFVDTNGAAGDHLYDTGETKKAKYYYDSTYGAGKERVSKSVEYLTSGNIKTVSVYNYGADTTNEYGWGDAKPRTLDLVETYRYTTDTSSDDNYTQYGYKQSVSLYSGHPGREKVEHVFTYARTGATTSTLKERSDYNYTLGLDDGLDLVTTYKITATDGYSLTAGTRASETYYVGYEGSEIADRVYSFNTQGGLKSCTIYQYGASNLADGASGLFASQILDNPDYYMVKSVSYKASLGVGGVYVLGNKTSETYYDVHLGKGDEIADRSFNFAGDGTTLKSLSTYEYGTITTGSIINGASGTSASATDSSEAVMVRSVSYKASLVGMVYTPGVKTSETYYDVHLGKGDEIADRSWNFAGNGIDLKSESIYEYGTITTGSIADGAAGNSASATLNAEDCMVRSVSYKASGFYVQGNKTSETYYDVHLGKGDEIADRSWNFKASGIIKEETVFEYGMISTGTIPGGTAGSSASATVSLDAVMVRSVSYKALGAYVPVIKTSETYYDVHLGKGDEIANYSYQYNNNGDTVATSVYFYGDSPATYDRAASLNSSDTAMTKAIGYRLGITVPDTGTPSGIEYTETYYVGDKGDERVKYTLNYESGGVGVLSTTWNFYGPGNDVADAAGITSNTPITQQKTWTGSVTSAPPSTNTDIINTINYAGDAGEERITQIIDRRGVEQDYTYSTSITGYHIATVTVQDANTTRTQYTYETDQYGDDRIKEAYDYLNAITTEYHYTAAGMLDYTEYAPPVKVAQLDLAGNFTTVDKYVKTTYISDISTYYEAQAGEYTETIGGVVTRKVDYTYLSGALLNTVETGPQGVSTTYHKINAYGEDEIDYVIQPDGSTAYYNYDYISDSSYLPNGDTTLTFRTVISRSVSAGSSNTFDSISILNKFGDTAMTVDANAVTQYHNYYTSLPSYNIPGEEQDNVLQAVYTYDLNGRLLNVEQIEMKNITVTSSFTVDTGLGPKTEYSSQTTYAFVDTEYKYGYTLDAKQNIVEARAYGTVGGAQYKDMYFDSQMRLTETWENIPVYNQGVFTGYHWGESQSFIYAPGTGTTTTGTGATGTGGTGTGGAGFGTIAGGSSFTSLSGAPVTVSSTGGTGSGSGTGGIRGTGSGSYTISPATPVTVSSGSSFTIAAGASVSISGATPVTLTADTVVNPGTSVVIMDSAPATVTGSGLLTFSSSLPFTITNEEAYSITYGAPQMVVAGTTYSAAPFNDTVVSAASGNVVVNAGSAPVVITANADMVIASGSSVTIAGQVPADGAEIQSGTEIMIAAGGSATFTTIAQTGGQGVAQGMLFTAVSDSGYAITSTGDFNAVETVAYQTASGTTPSTTLGSLLSALVPAGNTITGLVYNEADPVNTGNFLNSITLNGVTYNVDPSSIYIADEFGTAITWADFKAMYDTNSIHSIKITGQGPVEGGDGNGTATRIEMVSVMGSATAITTNGQNKAITIGANTYNINTAALKVVDEFGQMHDLAWLDSQVTAQSPKNVWVSLDDNGNVWKIAFAFAYVAIGQNTLMVNSGTSFYDKNGNPISMQAISDELSANPDSTYVKIAYQESNGQPIATRIDLIEGQASEVVGGVGTVFNPAVSGVSIMSGVMVSVTPGNRTFSFGGQNVTITGGEADGTVISSSDGNTVYGATDSDSDKANYLQRVWSSLNNQNLYAALKVVAFYDGAKWIAKEIVITSDLPYIGETNLQGAITNVDETNATITFNGQTMSFAGALITDVNGNPYSQGAPTYANDLSRLLAENGGNVFARITVAKTDAEWAVSDVTLVSDIHGETTMAGAIAGASLASGTVTVRGVSIATDGTMIINGQTVYVPSAAGIMTNESGAPYTLQQLSEIIAYNSGFSEATSADATFGFTDDGKLVLESLTVRTSLNTHLEITASISAVARSGNALTVTLTDGTEFTVDSSTAITDDMGLQQNVDYLETYGVDKLAEFQLVRGFDNVWRADSVTLTSGFEPHGTLEGVLTAVSGQTAVSNHVFKLGEFDVTISDNTTLVKEDNSTLTDLSDIENYLNSLYSPAGQSNLTVDIEQANDGHGNPIWVADKITVDSTVSKSVTISATNNSIQYNGTSITVGGISFALDANPSIQLQYYDWRNVDPGVNTISGNLNSIGSDSGFSAMNGLIGFLTGSGNGLMWAGARTSVTVEGYCDAGGVWHATSIKGMDLTRYETFTRAVTSGSAVTYQYNNGGTDFEVGGLTMRIDDQRTYNNLGAAFRDQSITSTINNNYNNGQKTTYIYGAIVYDEAAGRWVALKLDWFTSSTEQSLDISTSYTGWVDISGAAVGISMGSGGGPVIVPFYDYSTQQFLCPCSYDGTPITSTDNMWQLKSGYASVKLETTDGYGWTIHSLDVYSTPVMDTPIAGVLTVTGQTASNGWYSAYGPFNSPTPTMYFTLGSDYGGGTGGSTYVIADSQTKISDPSGVLWNYPGSNDLEYLANAMSSSNTYSLSTSVTMSYDSAYEGWHADNIVIYGQSIKPGMATTLTTNSSSFYTWLNTSSLNGDIVMADGTPVDASGAALTIYDINNRAYQGSLAGFIADCQAKGYAAYVGVDGNAGKAIQTGAIGDSQTSEFSRSVTMAHAGTATFRWKVSSEAATGQKAGDVFHFFVDGQEISSISGFTDWITVNTPLSAGDHILRWVYSKDGSASAGYDAGWVNDLSVRYSTETAVDVTIPFLNQWDMISGTISSSYSPGTVVPLPSAYTTSSGTPFYGENNVVSQGNADGFAAQACNVTNGTSSMDTHFTVSGGQYFNFWWKCSSGAAKSLSYSVYDGGGNVVGSAALPQGTDWTQVNITGLSGSYTIRWTYANTGPADTAGNTAWIDGVAKGGTITDNFEGVSNAATAGYCQGDPDNNGTWVSGYGNIWVSGGSPGGGNGLFLQPAYSYITNTQTYVSDTYSIYKEFDLGQGGGSLSFQYVIGNYNGINEGASLKLFVDGAYKGLYTSRTLAQISSIALGAGKHTVAWEFYGGADCSSPWNTYAYLDNVTVTNGLDASSYKLTTASAAFRPDELYTQADLAQLTGGATGGWDFNNVWQIGSTGGVPTLRATGPLTHQATMPAGYTKISTAAQLATAIVTNDASKKYWLANDITLTGSFTPIGTAASPFNGIFDGNGYSITGLNINSTGTTDLYTGLFGYTQGATIKNLVLNSPTIYGNGYSANMAAACGIGGLIGYASGGTIANCYVTGGSVTGGTSAIHIGGLVGDSAGTSISASYSMANVSGGHAMVGGLVGYAASPVTINSSYSSGNVSSDGWWAGSLIGAGSGSTISNSYSTGAVPNGYSTGHPGGMIGEGDTAAITNSYCTAGTQAIWYGAQGSSVSSAIPLVSPADAGSWWMGEGVFNEWSTGSGRSIKVLDPYSIDDGMVEVGIKAIPGGSPNCDESLVYFRYNAASQSGYAAGLDGVGNIRLYRVDGGTYTVIGSGLISDYYATGYYPPQYYKIKVSFIGGTINVYAKNDTAGGYYTRYIAGVTDNTYLQAGSIGLGAFNISNYIEFEGLHVQSDLALEQDFTDHALPGGFVSEDATVVYTDAAHGYALRTGDIGSTGSTTSVISKDFTTSGGTVQFDWKAIGNQNDQFTFCIYRDANNDGLYTPDEIVSTDQISGFMTSFTHYTSAQLAAGKYRLVWTYYKNGPQATENHGYINNVSIGAAAPYTFDNALLDGFTTAGSVSSSPFLEQSQSIWHGTSISAHAVQSANTGWLPMNSRLDWVCTWGPSGPFISVGGMDIRISSELLNKIYLNGVLVDLNTLSGMVSWPSRIFSSLSIAIASDDGGATWYTTSANSALNFYTFSNNPSQGASIRGVITPETPIDAYSLDSTSALFYVTINGCQVMFDSTSSVNGYVLNGQLVNGQTMSVLNLYNRLRSASHSITGQIFYQNGRYFAKNVTIYDTSVPGDTTSDIYLGGPSGIQLTDSVASVDLTQHRIATSSGMNIATDGVTDTLTGGRTFITTLYSMIYDEDNRVITLSDLEALREKNPNGFFIEVADDQPVQIQDPNDTNIIHQTVTRYIHVVTRTPAAQPSFTATGAVDRVDVAAKTITIGGYTYSIDPAVLAALNINEGVPTGVEIVFHKDGNNYVIDQAKTVSVTEFEPTTTPSTAAQSVAGIITCLPGAQQFSVNGIDMVFDASNASFVDGSGSDIAWADLANIIASNSAGTAQVPTYGTVEISSVNYDATSGRWIATVSKVTLASGNGVGQSINGRVTAVTDTGSGYIITINDSARDIQVQVPVGALYGPDGRPMLAADLENLITSGQAVFVQVDGSPSAGGAFAASNAAVSIYEQPAAPQAPDLTQTTPYIEVNGQKTYIAAGAEIWDKRDPLLPVRIDMAQLSDLLNADPTLEIVADTPAGQTAASTISIVKPAPSVINPTARASIISQVTTWLGDNAAQIFGTNAQAAIANITSWLNNQDEHFGVSAFNALAFLLNPVFAAGQVAGFFAEMAARAIELDIKNGVTSYQPAGALTISLDAMRLAIAEMTKKYLGLSVGQEAYAYNVTFDELKNLVNEGNRVIVHTGGEHYLVVTAIDDTWGTVTILEDNRETKTSAESFLGLWDGTVLSLIKPASGIALDEAAQELISGAGPSLVAASILDGFIYEDPYQPIKTYKHWYGTQAIPPDLLYMYLTGGAAAITGIDGINLVDEQRDSSGTITGISCYGADPSILNDKTGKLLWSIDLGTGSNGPSGWDKTVVPTTITDSGLGLNSVPGYKVTYNTYTTDLNGKNYGSEPGLVVTYYQDPATGKYVLYQIWHPKYGYVDTAGAEAGATTLSQDALSKIMGMTIDKKNGASTYPAIPVNIDQINRAYGMMRDYTPPKTKTNPNPATIKGAFTIYNEAYDKFQNDLTSGVIAMRDSIKAAFQSYIASQETAWNTFYDGLNGFPSLVKGYMDDMADQWKTLLSTAYTQLTDYITKVKGDVDKYLQTYVHTGSLDTYFEYANNYTGSITGQPVTGGKILPNADGTYTIGTASGTITAQSYQIIHDTNNNGVADPAEIDAAFQATIAAYKASTQYLTGVVLTPLTAGSFTDIIGTAIDGTVDGMVTIIKKAASDAVDALQIAINNVNTAISAIDTPLINNAIAQVQMMLNTYNVGAGYVSGAPAGNNMDWLTAASPFANVIDNSTGKKVATIISGYLTDAETYLQNIKDTINGTAGGTSGVAAALGSYLIAIKNSLTIYSLSPFVPLSDVE